MRNNTARRLSSLVLIAIVGFGTTACNSETMGSGPSGSPSSPSSSSGSSSSPEGSSASSSGSSNSSSTSSQSTVKSGSLSKVAGTPYVKSIRVTNGHEGMSYAKDGTVKFFESEDGTSWKQVGSSRAPESHEQSTPKIDAAELGDFHAVFVVNSSLPGVGHRFAAGFSNGSGVWGPLTKDGNDLVVNTKGSQANWGPIELELSDQGLIETSPWDNDASTAERTAHPIVRAWKANGEGTFILKSDNVFRAEPVTVEPAEPEKGEENTGDGRFTARIVSVDGNKVAFKPQVDNCDPEPEVPCGPEDGAARSATLAPDARASILVGVNENISAPQWVWTQSVHGAPNLSNYREGSSYVVPSKYTAAEQTYTAILQVKDGRIVAADTVSPGN